jgi:hypothetical protein
MWVKEPFALARIVDRKTSNSRLPPDRKLVPALDVKQGKCSGVNLHLDMNTHARRRRGEARLVHGLVIGRQWSYAKVRACQHRPMTARNKENES